VSDPGVVVHYSMAHSDSDTVHDENAEEKLASPPKKVKNLTWYKQGW
jgi:hypothetical protein